MRLGYLLLAGIAITLVACGEKPAEEQQTIDPSCAHIMTNDEIIAETNKCNSAGLDAMALHCGDDHQTVIIECRPRPLQSLVTEEQ